MLKHILSSNLVAELSGISLTFHCAVVVLTKSSNLNIFFVVFAPHNHYDRVHSKLNEWSNISTHVCVVFHSSLTKLNQLRLNPKKSSV